MTFSSVQKPLKKFWKFDGGCFSLFLGKWNDLYNFWNLAWSAQNNVFDVFPTDGAVHSGQWWASIDVHSSMHTGPNLTNSASNYWLWTLDFKLWTSDFELQT